MKSKIIVLVLCYGILTCCSKNDEEVICGVSDPIGKLQWLNESVAELKTFDNEVAKYVYISEATYESQTVFIFDNCCPFCNTVISVLNCEGENIGLLGTDIERDEIENRRIIYRPDNFACSDP